MSTFFYIFWKNDLQKVIFWHFMDFFGSRKSQIFQWFLAYLFCVNDAQKNKSCIVQIVEKNPIIYFILDLKGKLW